MSDFQILVIIMGVVALIPATWIPLHIFRTGRFNKAADTFRNKVITGLEGIYPITHPWWDENLFPKFQSSVSSIETASAEFRHFIKRKSELDATVKNYHDYCQQRKYKKALYLSMFPNSPKPPNESGIDPVEEFKNIVEHLLSFANEK